MKSNVVSSYAENDIPSGDDAHSQSITSLTSSNESMKSPSQNNLQDSSFESPAADEYCNTFLDLGSCDTDVRDRTTAVETVVNKNQLSCLSNSNKNGSAAPPATIKRTRKPRTRGVENPQTLIKV